MEIVLDHEGNDITNDLRLIWMIETIKVIGSLGTEKYFIKRKQYRYSAIVEDSIPVMCQPCDGSTLRKYYRVVDNEENFDVSALSCIEDDKPRKVWEQDYYSFLEHKSDQPRDYIQEYKNITGIDLIDQNMPVTEGGEYLYDENIKTRQEKQGKRYGSVEIREEEPL